MIFAVVAEIHSALVLKALLYLSLLYFMPIGKFFQNWLRYTQIHCGFLRETVPLAVDCIYKTRCSPNEYQVFPLVL